VTDHHTAVRVCVPASAGSPYWRSRFGAIIWRVAKIISSQYYVPSTHR